MSTFWSLWIIVIVVINIGGALWLLLANRKVEIKGDLKHGEAPKTGHVYDGIEEYDNPLPGWWFKMFIASVVFSVVYLVLYPGLGSFKGVLNWTSENQWQEEITAAEQKYGPLFAKHSNTTIEELSINPGAMKMAGRLFANNCSTCHGSDGRGTYGFPNLADADWLYGGAPNAIKTTITNGRGGIMTPWGAILKEDGVTDVTNYVLELSGRNHDTTAAERGKQTFMTYCMACHGTDGKGNQLLGAPNLTDNIWLYGGSPEIIKQSIRDGRQGKMPAHGELLKEDKIHLLTAYVFSLHQRQ